MESYQGFAAVYDELMDNVPYDAWAEGYVRILKQYGIEDGLICDLACGTGNMTLLLARRGFDMIGIDASYAMLDLARKKDPEGRILFLEQDMCEFELYGTVRAVTLACDSLNYLLSPDQVLEMFRLVNNYLDPGGIFLFDFNTTEKYRDLIGEQVISENREDCSFIWDNYFDEETQINECHLTLFVQQGDEGLFRRLEETHLQRGYEKEQILSLLKQAGLSVEAVMTMEQAHLPEDEGRLLVVARETRKKQVQKDVGEPSRSEQTKEN
ncbi:MAG: class I SAM-dependent methyltransferase [Lachnospiraceae bacterium]|nr:class I SAM-dependent methyltransferase [Lachnospiraceae bacterium]